MSSLHATDATSALHQLTDMGIEPFPIRRRSSTSSASDWCGGSARHAWWGYGPPGPERDLDELFGFGGGPKTPFVHGVGRNNGSGTGSCERVGVSKVLAVSDEIGQVLVGAAATQDVRALAVTQGMRIMSKEAMALVAEDDTTIDAGLRIVDIS